MDRLWLNFTGIGAVERRYVVSYDKDDPDLTRPTSFVASFADSCVVRCLDLRPTYGVCISFALYLFPTSLTCLSILNHDRTIC